MITVTRTEEWPGPEWSENLGAVRVESPTGRGLCSYRGTWHDHAHWVPPEVRAAAERLWEANRPLGEHESRTPHGCLRTLSLEGDTLRAGPVTYSRTWLSRLHQDIADDPAWREYWQSLLDYYDTHHPKQVRSDNGDVWTLDGWKLVRGGDYWDLTRGHLNTEILAVWSWNWGSTKISDPTQREKVRAHLRGLAREGTTKLLPCPFCGAATASIEGTEVTCGTCQGYTWGGDAAAAVENWNRRSTPEHLTISGVRYRREDAKREAKMTRDNFVCVELADGTGNYVLLIPRLRPKTGVPRGELQVIGAEEYSSIALTPDDLEELASECLAIAKAIKKEGGNHD